MFGCVHLFDKRNLQSCKARLRNGAYDVGPKPEEYRLHGLLFLLLRSRVFWRGEVADLKLS